MDPIRRNEINIAPLQISTRPPKLSELDKSGHFHYRKDIVKVYNEKPSGVISRKEIFKEAKKRAAESAKGCSSAEAKAKHIPKHENLVFLAGHAGVGKSTLSKVLVQEMLDPDNRLYQAEFVFLIRFRDLDYDSNNLNLLQFLTISTPFISNLTSEDRAKIIHYLETSDNVYIVLDGLDEADLELGKKYQTCDARSVTTAAIFIHNLLTGCLLQKSKKLVTSRPRQLALLPDVEFSSYLYLNLLGLSNEGQAQICRDLCHDDTAQVDRILRHINSRPDLKSLCYVPIICIVVMMSLCSTNSMTSNVNTLTTVLVYALEKWFLKKAKGDFQNKNISNLAFDAFLFNQLSFRKHRLESYKINPKTATTVLTATITFQLLQGKAVSYFAHLMWQELFVAMKLRLYASKEDVQAILPKLESDKFEVVTRFLFGLCNKQTMDELLNCVDIEELNSRTDREECEGMLKEFAIGILQSYRDAERNFASILPVLSWVREMGDLEFTMQAAACLRDEVEIDWNVEILPSDVINLNHVLRARCTELALTLDLRRFIESCSQYFYNELSATMVEKPNIQVSCRMSLMEDFKKDLCIDKMSNINQYLYVIYRYF